MLEFLGFFLVVGFSSKFRSAGIYKFSSPYSENVYNDSILARLLLLHYLFPSCPVFLLCLPSLRQKERMCLFDTGFLERGL